MRTLRTHVPLPACLPGSLARPSPTDLSLAQVATAQATRFGVFELVPEEVRTKSRLHTALSGERSRGRGHGHGHACVCVRPLTWRTGAMAGAVSVLAFQWVDVIKSRVQGLEGHLYDGPIDCLKKVGPPPPRPPVGVGTQRA